LNDESLAINFKESREKQLAVGPQKPAFMVYAKKCFQLSTDQLFMFLKKKPALS